MKTEVIMKRELFGREISQKSKSEFFSATDLVRAGNRWRMLNDLKPFDMTAWFKNKQVTEFIDSLEKQFGKVKISGRGRGNHTWIHPYLFIDMALAISPELKIEVYAWIMDGLLKYRNDSGDSYKKMGGALYINQQNKSLFPKYITDVASKIKLACHVSDWETADESQLKLRDKIQENISLLSEVLRDNDQAVKISILKAVKYDK